ncbi:MAG: hypothetical protein AAGA34_07555 [Pseudomonadota bacterium]
MAARDLFERLGDKIAGTRPQPEGAWAQGSEPPTLAPLGGTREQAVQRLQVGLTGLCAMILMVGVASVLGGQADIAEDAAVPDAAPTTEPSPATAQRDPLADAGVVPDIPTEPEVIVEEPGEDGLGAKESEDGAITVPDTPPTEPQVDIDAP